MAILPCDAVHESGVRCEMPEGQHQWHTGVVQGSMPPQSVDWLNEDYIAPSRHRTKGQRAQHKAMLLAAVRGESLDEIKRGWSATKEAWLAEARKVLHDYCRQHGAPFTTAEDIWPLLDAPGEMRAFVTPVQHALRRRWMVEVGSKRLRGVYVTRDGREFEENKLVPVYQSRIAFDPAHPLPARGTHLVFE